MFLSTSAGGPSDPNARVNNPPHMNNINKGEDTDERTRNTAAIIKLHRFFIFILILRPGKSVKLNEIGL